MDKAQIQIPLNQLAKRKCHCGSEVFIPTVNLRELSALISPNGQAGVVFVDSGFVCLACQSPAILTPPIPKTNLVAIEGGHTHDG